MVTRKRPTVAEAVAAVNLVNGDWESNKAIICPGKDEDGPSWAVVFYDDCFASRDVAVFPAVICVFDTESEAKAFSSNVLAHLT